MNKTFVILSFLLLTHFTFAQEKETIVISKNKVELFRGQSQEVSNWFVYVDANRIWYMANLTIPENEVRDWFEKRKDSDNIFKGAIGNGMYPTLLLSKPNEEDMSLKFYVKFEKENEIVKRLILTSIDDGNNYVFERK